VTAEPTGAHPNPAGTGQGGVGATMIDVYMALAIQTTLDKGVGCTTLEFKMSFVRPITPETGPIKVEDAVISRGRRREGRVTDSKGSLLVHDTTTRLIFEN
jgi:acyl-coenzyme A thioesterase PaaI-like protein